MIQAKLKQKNVSYRHTNDILRISCQSQQNLTEETNPSHS